MKSKKLNGSDYRIHRVNMLLARGEIGELHPNPKRDANIIDGFIIVRKFGINILR